jgi:hypothetical protein
MPGGRKKGSKNKNPKYAKYVCWVCGETLHDRKRATCGMALCRATALVYPQRESINHDNYAAIKYSGQKREVPRKVRFSPGDAQAAVRIVDASILQPADWSIHGYVLTEDRRGIALEGGRDTIWGFLSRKNVYLKSRGRPSKPSMVIQRLAGVSVASHVKRRLMGDEDKGTDKLIDIFYAWRCPCQNRHEVIYEQIEDLPNTDGYHDACGNCGAAPLEVSTWHQHQTNP